MTPRSPLVGRAAAISLGLLSGFLILGYGVLRVLELAPGPGRASGGESPALDTPEGHEPPGPASEAWHATLELGGRHALAWLLPLHAEPELEDFRARRMRTRYELPPGTPWRLALALEPGSEGALEPLRLSSARIEDEQGVALVPLGEALGRRPDAEGTEPRDPLLALYAAPPGELDAEVLRPWLLWGRAPGAGARLVLEAGAESGTGALEPTPDPPDLRRWFAGQRSPSVELDLQAEITRLEAELLRERQRLAEREQAFQEFSRILTSLPLGASALGAVGLEGASAEPPPETPEERERREAAEQARARAEEIAVSLRVLMRVEGLRGLDLLEPGSLLPGAIGPVVFRCLDEHGLLAGSLGAERLRLEGSRAAHTLTLVLEDGFESRGGERVPFLEGRRRITLRGVDPDDWFERCPELFSGQDLAHPRDDGRWSASDVRRELNRLLALDTRAGWFRLHSLGGVRGTVLLDVQLEELESTGRLRRRIFADELELRIEDGSVVLQLDDGAFVRGEEQEPFRDGRHRIVLAGVPLEAWRAASLPGLSPPPGEALPPAPPDSPGEEGPPGG